VPSVPLTPCPAAAGPVTGGQICAQAPVHFDAVAVSGANEYKVATQRAAGPDGPAH